MLGGDFVNKMKNIYEDLDIIELENLDDMADIFFESWYEAPKRKTVALVADKELVSYVMEIMLDSDETAVKYIDLTGGDAYESGEWMILIDQDGNLTVKELEWYRDLDEADVVLISMEGDVSQVCINHCLNKDMEVHLFGYADDEELPEADWCPYDCCHDCDCKGDCDENDGKEKKGTISLCVDDDDVYGFSAERKLDNGHMSCSYYSSEKLSPKTVAELLESFGF